MKITFIGGGPGGYEAAIYAAKRGAEVTVIEKNKVGGTCLNRGCIPTKAFLASSEVLETAETAEKFGIMGVGELTPDYPAILARKNKLTESLVKGIHFMFDKAGITYINGFGKVTGPHSIEVTKEDGSTANVETDYIVLATGSVPVTPGMFKVDGKRVVTSDEILDFDKAPESIIIVGGGVIGCEIGQFLRKMGSEVTIVEALDRIMATMDEDVTKQITRQFKKDKIKVIAGDGVAEVNPSEDGVSVKLNSGKELEAEYLLLSIGRRGFTEGLGLEEAGVNKDEKGRVVVDEYMRTNVETIFAIGDIVASPQLAHVASREGMVAVDNILGDKVKMTYHAVPGCVFTTPQLASVGKLETQLTAEGKEAGKDYKVGSFDLKGLGKAQASGHIAGFVKVITDAEDTLIGAEIVGANASDMLQVLTCAIEFGTKARDLGRCIFPHPTMCEAIKEALHDLHGLSVNKI